MSRAKERKCRALSDCGMLGWGRREVGSEACGRRPRLEERRRRIRKATAVGVWLVGGGSGTGQRYMV